MFLNVFIFVCERLQCFIKGNELKITQVELLSFFHFKSVNNNEISCIECDKMSKIIDLKQT